MNTPFIILYFSFLVYLYLTVYTLRFTKNRLGFIFSCICMALAIWSLSTGLLFIAGEKEGAFFWMQVSAPSWSFLPVLLLHFSLVLTGKEGPWKRILPLFYLPGLLFTLLEIGYGYQAVDFTQEAFGWNTIPRDDSPIFWAFNSYYVVYLLSSTLLIYRWGLQARIKRHQRQARLITPALLISFLLVLINETLLPLLGIMLPKVPAAIGLIWVFSIWYAMNRHRLMEFTPELATHEIISSIQDMMILIDPRGRITRINARVTENLSLEEEDLMGCDALLLLKEKPRHWEDLLQGNRPSLSLETEIVGKNGALLPMQVLATAVKDLAGDLTGVVLVLHDLSENKNLQQEIGDRKRIEEDLQTSNQRLLELAQVKTDFLSTVSHELRTPLTSILGFAQIIKKRYEEVIIPGLTAVQDKKTQRHIKQLKSNIDIIVSEGKRLTQLINDVLDMARMEAGRTEWEMEQVELREVIETAANTLAPAFEEKGLGLEMEVQKDLPPIEGDRERLIQTLENLLSNAHKFTQEGCITIRAHERKNQVVIQLTDTGPGIPQEDLESIFDTFKQVGDTLTDKPQGTGLGLPICRQIVEHHGGKIWAQSTPGQGSTFFLTLPAKKGGKILTQKNLLGLIERITPHLKKKEVESEGKKTILVVDDEAPIRDLLRQELEEAGYGVEEAQNGHEALEAVKNHDIQLIILDIMMPGLNGLETAALLKKDPCTQEIPIVILSILEDKKKGFTIGVDRYLNKPVNIQQLLQEIGELLQKEGQKKVLVVDEKKENSHPLKEIFWKKGYDTLWAGNGEEGIRKAQEEKPQLVLVSADLFQKDPHCKELRLQTELEEIQFVLVDLEENK